MLVFTKREEIGGFSSLGVVACKGNKVIGFGAGEINLQYEAFVSGIPPLSHFLYETI
jgi:hypothetical protein